MRQKDPRLPRCVASGPKNPLGYRILYLREAGTGADKMYRIHGTNDELSIGGDVSSGCIRMRNVHGEQLHRMVKVGAPVVVVP